MNFGKSVCGMLEVELTSAELESALSEINAKGIVLQDLRFSGMLTCRFYVRRKAYSELCDICQKRGESLRIAGRTGLYWTGMGLLRRPVLTLGMLLLLITATLLPGRIFFVQVEGNDTIPDRRILAAAEDCGIAFGASRRNVRSEKMKNALLAAVPELKWAGVNTYGCVAVISVREGAKKTETEEEKVVTNIVAARDGFILSGTATQGNPLFQVGQAVKQGQILISGYTDCGICIQATRAKGEIFCQTNRKILAVTPSECLFRGEAQETIRKFSLLFRKKRINLWKDSGIYDASCVRMYEEYYVTLPGGFQLPLALCVETFTHHDIIQGEILREDAELALKDFSRRYTRQQMVAGSILECQERISLSDGRYCLTGEYICTEMIGREQREQIGE